MHTHVYREIEERNDQLVVLKVRQRLQKNYYLSKDSWSTLSLFIDPQPSCRHGLAETNLGIRNTLLQLVQTTETNVHVKYINFINLEIELCWGLRDRTDSFSESALCESIGSEDWLKVCRHCPPHTRTHIPIGLQGSPQDKLMAQQIGKICDHI